jgi:hypothetical protein
MPAYPRHEIVAEDQIGVYHCIARCEAVIFSELGLILYSDHDLIPCMDSAPWTPRHPSVAQEQRHDTAPV